MTVPEHPSQAETQHHNGWAYTDEGEGPVVIALHGMPGTVRDFRWLAGELSESARVIRIDMPGFGQTQVDAGASPADIASAIVDFIDSLELSSPPLLMCHSFGSVYGMEVAARYPTRVQGIIFIAPVSLRKHRAYRQLPPMPVFKLATTLPGIRQKMVARFAKALEKSGFRDVTERDALRTIQCLNSWSWERQNENARLIAQPSFCAWCDDDPLIEPEIVKELMDVLGCDRLHFQTGGHNPQKTQAIELAVKITAWIDETQSLREPTQTPPEA